MINTIDPGTTKGSALAGSNSSVQIVTLAFIARDDERGTIQVSKHWGAPIEYGPTLYERPRVHPRLRMRKAQEVIATANDLIALDSHGMHAACYVAGPHPVRAVEPQVWKKQAVKCMHHRAALKYLSQSEFALLCLAYGHANNPNALVNYIEKACTSYARTRKLTGYSSLVVDLLDTVCLNLWETGRFRV